MGTDYTTDYIFEEPPPSGSGRPSIYGPWCDGLRSAPGRWARYPEAMPRGRASQAAHGIKSGDHPGMKAGEFEAVSRTVDGAVYLYARYVGGQS